MRTVWCVSRIPTFCMTSIFFLGQYTQATRYDKLGLWICSESPDWASNVIGNTIRQFSKFSQISTNYCRFYSANVTCEPMRKLPATAALKRQCKDFELKPMTCIFSWGCTNYFRYNWVFHDRTTVFVLVSSMYVVFKIKTLQHFLKSFLADKLSI